MPAVTVPARTVHRINAEFGEAGKDPLRNWKCLLNPRSTCKKESHIHPLLSPDGTMGFLNSDEPGILDASMPRGF